MIDRILSDEILQELGFKDNGLSPFEAYRTMGYWVKNQVCLFYNTSKVDYQESYLAGYAEIRRGEYTAVSFRWINHLDELSQIYKALTTKVLDGK